MQTKGNPLQVVRECSYVRLLDTKSDGTRTLTVLEQFSGTKLGRYVFYNAYSPKNFLVAAAFG